MKIAILSANLGSFDSTPQDPVIQESKHKIVFHRFTDKDFPPIIGLTSRLQYRIPKMFGWEMFPTYDIYIWLDSSMSLCRSDSVEWLLGKLGEADMAFFKHPWRNTVKQEVDHIEEYLNKGNKYITDRYKGGLHKEFYNSYLFKDDVLFASNVFIYKNNDNSTSCLMGWWYLQSRYFTCDQVHLPRAIKMTDVKVNKIDEDVFKNSYISLVSHHK